MGADEVLSSDVSWCGVLLAELTSAAVALSTALPRESIDIRDIGYDQPSKSSAGPWSSSCSRAHQRQRPSMIVDSLLTADDSMCPLEAPFFAEIDRHRVGWPLLRIPATIRGRSASMAARCDSRTKPGALHEVPDLRPAQSRVGATLRLRIRLCVGIGAGIVFNGQAAPFGGQTTCAWISGKSKLVGKTNRRAGARRDGDQPADTQVPRRLSLVVNGPSIRVPQAGPRQRRLNRRRMVRFRRLATCRQPKRAS
jgi:hypothetical protein